MTTEAKTCPVCGEEGGSRTTTLTLPCPSVTTWSGFDVFTEANIGSIATTNGAVSAPIVTISATRGGIKSVGKGQTASTPPKTTSPSPSIESTSSATNARGGSDRFTATGASEGRDTAAVATSRGAGVPKAAGSVEGGSQSPTKFEGGVKKLDTSGIIYGLAIVLYGVVMFAWA